MKRAVLCVTNPEQYIDQLADYSLMIINPDSTPSRLEYLLSHSDYSLLITQHREHQKDGKDYPNERVLWYTSGTTGDSKFYSFTQQQLDHMSQTIINSYRLTSNDRYLSIILGMVLIGY
jgi:long-subunit acyl-CoA synthetase (AMP-forming)